MHELRHRLHELAETSGNESETKAYLKAWLEDHGLVVEEFDAGLLAHKSGAKPETLLRAELDALPLQEKTGAAYASTRAHHACGHDGHMAMLGHAMVEATGNTWALFQSAEETGEGMQQCLTHIDHPWKRVYAIHNVPGFAEGDVLIRRGSMALASTGVAMTMQGKTSHAAEPQLAENRLFEAGRLIQQWEDDPYVAVVGLQGGGPNYGIAAGSATLHLTMRAPSDEELQARLAPLGDVSLVEPFPATVNHDDAVADVIAAAGNAGLKVQELDAPFAWSEDFGYATKKWPGALIGLGSGDIPNLHSPTYDFPDTLLAKGVKLWQSLM